MSHSSYRSYVSYWSYDPGPRHFTFPPGKFPRFVNKFASDRIRFFQSPSSRLSLGAWALPRGSSMPSSSAGAPSGGGHGGGGALDVLSLLALASIALGYCNSRCAASSQVRCARR